jgi:hypothetical protein
MTSREPFDLYLLFLSVSHTVQMGCKIFFGMVMKILKQFFLVSCCLYYLIPRLSGYNLPSINLGQSNILDGGPLRIKSGWYWKEYLHYYHADKFLDGKGQLLGGIPSPHFDSLAIITQLLYQFKTKVLGAKPGLNFFLPFVAYSHVEKNHLGISTSGSGIGDFLTGVYIQWAPITHHGTMIFMTRLAIDVSFPTGKNRQPQKNINPGNHIYFINPYWAATLHFTKDWAISWRLHYLWSSKNRATHIQAGDAVHLNYDMEYQVLPKLWLAVTGYFLQQLNDSRLSGHNIPNSRERVLGIGPGLLYTFPKEYRLSSYLYCETMVKSRPQGIRFVVRLIKHF